MQVHVRADEGVDWGRLERFGEVTPRQQFEAGAKAGVCACLARAHGAGAPGLTLDLAELSGISG